MTKPRLVLCRGARTWVARFPDEPDLCELYGTDTFPTTLPLDLDDASALREMQTRTPSRHVIVGTPLHAGVAHP